MADPLLTEYKELSTTVGKRPFFGRYLMEEASQFAVSKKTWDESSLLVELGAIEEVLSPLILKCKRKIDKR